MKLRFPQGGKVEKDEKPVTGGIVFSLRHLRDEKNTYIIKITRVIELKRRPLMKTKLTVTIEKDLVPKAKRYARTHGVSLSRLIENNLHSLVDSKLDSFSERWRGKLSISPKEDQRFKRLTQKYL